MKRNVTFLILIFVATLMACSDGSGAKGVSNTKAQKTVSAKKSNDFDANRIAFKFYFDALEKCDQSHDNIVVSPFSGLIQINGLVNATETKTLSELFKLLEFKGTKEQWNNQVMLPLSKHYKNPSGLQMVNSLWIAKDFQVKESFITQCAKGFPLYVGNVDFTNEQTTKDINTWFANSTSNKIMNLFDSVPAQTKVMLGNALYFHGQWEKKFNPENTTKGFFTTYDNKEIRCKIMDIVDKFFCYHNERYKVFKMNYEKDGRFYMLVFIPDTSESFSTLEKQLSPSMINNVEKKLKPMQIHVRLPKFTSAGKIDMIPILNKNGVKAIFEKDADFSALADTKGDKECIAVSQMFQQIVIDVDEQGTEAAVVDPVIIEPKQKPEDFYADRPFMYLIKDKKTNQILFIGRFVNPNGNSNVQPQEVVPEESQPEKEPTETTPVEPDSEQVDPTPTPANPGHETVI